MWLSVMLMQDRLKNALRACEKNSCFALEQLERAAHEATGVCVAESRKIYKLGKEHLVPFLCCEYYVEEFVLHAKRSFYMCVIADESQGKPACCIHAGRSQGSAYDREY